MRESAPLSLSLSLILCLMTRLLCLAPSTQVYAFLPTGTRPIHQRNAPSVQASIYPTENEQAGRKSDLFSIDPLLTNVLLEASTSSLDLGGIVSASSGIRIWRAALTKGRLPTDADFLEGSQVVWPAEPLFSQLSKTMVTLQLPRFTLRHPETVTSVLVSLLRLTIQFMEDLRLQEDEKQEELEEEEEEEEDDLYFSWDEQQVENIDDPVSTIDDASLSSEDIEKLAADIAGSLVEKWSGVVSGMTILDQLFGYDHGLLNVEEEESGGGVTVGFGLQDGIWRHTGWQEIPELQKKISSMPELKDLVRELGRRPTAENSDRIHKFSPRKLQKDGAMGAQFDPQMRESVSGITLSGSISEMLPSEAVLLRGSSRALRLLFLAKKAESKLLSYELSGWTDVPSVPLTRPLYMRRMPSAPGGPIIVCLDTSWSMSGMREQLSKAVVLACVSAAHKQGRECQVVAFSTERGLIEAGVITPDTLGTKRLLDFLSQSFGGGTDVTGALKFAMTTLDADVMSAADVLLITDGEIPDPPVSDEIMEALDRLKIRKGVEVHGLLVGKSESKPLSRLCTHTHDFLLGYDTLLAMSNSYAGSATALKASHQQAFAKRQGICGKVSMYQKRSKGFGGFHRRGRMDLALHAKYSQYDDDGGSGGKKRNKGRKDRQGDEDDDGYVLQEIWDSEDYDEEEDEEYERNPANGIAFSEAVDQAVKTLYEAAVETLASQAWKAEELDKERDAEGSCWPHRNELKIAVERVGEGLVERDEEARLVVLAMMAQEHVLLLGVPGTGKSILGRRLSKLCNGSFFQRLLTRFTTPEELFGPLSLRSLENDEYRRCTAGFLPTASIAFLDEIFKANSAILNTLLTILNERKFDNAGGQEFCPIRCVVGASNELPESDELIALFDRFLLRKEVHSVSDEGVMTMLSMSNPGISACDKDGSDSNCDVIFTEGLDELIGALSSGADYVHMGQDACELMRDLRSYMREEQNVEISDRRLVKASRLLKISAASHGRTRVDPIDCLLLQHCMWQLPEQRSAVRDWLWDNLTPCADKGVGSSLDQFRFLLDNLRREVVTAVRKTSGDVSGDHGGRHDDVVVIQSLRVEASRIASVLQQRQTDLARHIVLIRQSRDFLWLDSDDAQAMKQLLFPRAEVISVEVNRALEDARALELSLTKLPEAPRNDIRLSVIEQLWDEGYKPDVSFTDDELGMGMKEAKAKYDLEKFRKWKRARKRAQK